MCVQFSCYQIAISLLYSYFSGDRGLEWLACLRALQTVIFLMAKNKTAKRWLSSGYVSMDQRKYFLNVWLGHPANSLLRE